MHRLILLHLRDLEDLLLLLDLEDLLLLYHLRQGSWPQTELFAWLQATAGIDDHEMNRTFNNGIGMVVVLDAAQAQACAQTLREAGEQVFEIGVIAPRLTGAAVVVA